MKFGSNVIICKPDVDVSLGFSLLKESFKGGRVTLVALAGASRQPYSQERLLVDDVLKIIIRLQISTLEPRHYSPNEARFYVSEPGFRHGRRDFGQVKSIEAIIVQNARINSKKRNNVVCNTFDIQNCNNVYI